METEELRTRLAELGKSNLYFLCKGILGFERLTNDLHRELCWVVSHTEYNKKLVIVPRGHYKSTIATKGRTIQKLIQDPNRRILIVSASATNAERFLRHIKAVFEHNALFRWLYQEIIPDFEKVTWSNREVVVRRTKHFPEPSIDTAGVGTAITGRHYDTIIKDDIVDDKNTNTPELLENTIEWDAGTLPLFDDPESPTNEEIVIGTPWHKADMYSVKMADPDYMKYVRHSLEDGDGNADFESGSPIFPERFPRTKLVKIRERLANDELFFCQYMCDPRGGDSSQFHREWIQFYEKEPSLLNITVTTDPGSLRPDDGDYTATVVCGQDQQNNLFILHRTNLRLNPREIIEQWFDLYRMYPTMSTIGVEGVAYQRSLQFYAQEEMRKRNVFLPLIELKTDTRVSKEMRIKALIPRMQNKTIFFKPYMTDVVDQLLDFPKGRHDDLIDALAYQLQLLQSPPSETTTQLVDPFSIDYILAELAGRQLGSTPLFKTQTREEFYATPAFARTTTSN